MSQTVSVCICTYNRYRNLKKAIESVLRQTYQDLELIIVNDHSTDKTESVIKSYANSDNRIIAIHNQTNMGLAHNRNLAIRQATGKFFSFVDDDDSWQEDFVASFVALAQTCSDDYGVFIGGHQRCFYNATILETYNVDMLLKDALLQGYTPPVANQFYKTTLLQSVNGYDERIESGVDHDLWIRLAALTTTKIKSGDFACAIVNSDSNMLRMTTAKDDRIQKLAQSLETWKDELESIHPGYYEHLKVSYKDYFLQNTIRRAIKQKRYLQSIWALSHMHFLGQWFYKKMIALYKRFVIVYKVFIAKQRVINLKMTPAFPKMQRYSS